MEDVLRYTAGLALLVGVILLVARSNRAYRRDDPEQGLVVARTPAECVEMATSYMAEAGYSVAHVGEAMATYTRPKKPDTGVGVVLLLLGLIPGLLYFGLFRGTFTSTLVASRSGNGTRLIFSGDDQEARRDLFVWARERLT